MSLMWSWLGHSLTIGPIEYQPGAMVYHNVTGITIFVMKSGKVFAV